MDAGCVDTIISEHILAEAGSASAAVLNKRAGQQLWRVRVARGKTRIFAHPARSSIQRYHHG
ncbi:hypothetical protein AURDEDRAFT_169575 [Auricularia subglabra TFB-10046 SS5]|uniref:Uncharacterized protein n=1 Tax=Auricularia subglabra (strain TFB-10046 / SS5) TaxID=717982 RepID=J0WYT8_AURST|nr:hypothetical protein AURDEDRAFT_169575 [Auricularia subglabra TFB-10046 SS5]